MGGRAGYSPPCTPKGRRAMFSVRTVQDIDLIEELRLRRWARENYVPQAQRDTAWHPIILDEMCRKDTEAHTAVLAG